MSENIRQMYLAFGLICLLGGVLLVAIGVGLLRSYYHVPTINVRDFGAKGDGKTDDSAALDRAVEACAKRLPCKIYFPSGIYLVGGSSIAPSHFHNVVIEHNATSPEAELKK